MNLKRPSLFSQNSHTSWKKAFPKQLEAVNTFIFNVIIIFEDPGSIQCIGPYAVEV